MQTWCFTPVELSGRVGLIARRHGLKPDWGELTVRNFRGGAGNVSEGRTRTPLHTSKEWRAETLDLRLCAPVLYSTEKRVGNTRTVILVGSAVLMVSLRFMMRALTREANGALDIKRRPDLFCFWRETHYARRSQENGDARRARSRRQSAFTHGASARSRPVEQVPFCKKWPISTA